jgi:hypothetical protein
MAPLGREDRKDSETLESAPSGNNPPEGARVGIMDVSAVERESPGVRVVRGSNTFIAVQLWRGQAADGDGFGVQSHSAERLLTVCTLLVCTLLTGAK